jgi:hypothetical protein
VDEWSLVRVCQKWYPQTFKYYAVNKKEFYPNHGSYIIGMLKRTNPIININRGSNHQITHKWTVKTSHFLKSVEWNQHAIMRSHFNLKISTSKIIGIHIKWNNQGKICKLFYFIYIYIFLFFFLYVGCAMLGSLKLSNWPM